MKQIRFFYIFSFIFLVPFCSAAAGDDIKLADNTMVAEVWQQASGQTPEVVKEPGGGSSITWHGGITHDQYWNSAQGGNLNTPMTSGSFYKSLIHSDLRYTSPSGTVSYFQISLTDSNDKAVLTHRFQLNSLQLGVSGQTYQLAFGDVAPNFSPLSTSAALRGAAIRKQFGPAAATLTAGFIAESWEKLLNIYSRTQHVRDAYGLKLESAVGEIAQVYVTAQGYNDQKDDLNAGISSLPPAEDVTVTAGFNFRKDWFTLSGEAGRSGWKEDGGAWRRDNAWTLDAGALLGSLTLRAGHHHIGTNYSSVSVQPVNGIIESYLNGVWTALSWLSLNADIRETENRTAALQSVTSPNAKRANTLTTGANVSFEQLVHGLNLQAQQTVSDGKNTDGSANRRTGYGSTLSYASAYFNGSVGYTTTNITNGAAPSANGRTNGWTFNLGKSITDSAHEAPLWMVNGNLSLTLQNQALSDGSKTSNTLYGIMLSAQRAGLGSINGTYSYGIINVPLGGQTMYQHTALLEAVYPIKDQNLVKLYVRENNRLHGITGRYVERTAGFEFLYLL